MVKLLVMRDCKIIKMDWFTVLICLDHVESCLATLEMRECESAQNIFFYVDFSCTN